MLDQVLHHLRDTRPAIDAQAHCDGPCGIYDPASARIAAEAAVSMTKKMLALTPPEASDADAMAGYLNTMSRYAAIKEEQAHLAKFRRVELPGSLRSSPLPPGTLHHP